MALTGNIWTNLIGCLAFFFIVVWFFIRPDTHIQFQMIAVMGLALAAIVILLWDKFMDIFYRPLRAGIFSCIGLFRPRTHRKLAAELDREIFLFLKPATQRKFIWGLGWDFYAMFRYRLLTKIKRIRNVDGNRWRKANFRVTISENGLSISNITNYRQNVKAKKGFPISGPQCRRDGFPGTICYYFEVKGRMFHVGLSDGSYFLDAWITRTNSYSISSGHCNHCWLDGEDHRFELPEGAVQPRRKCNGNVFGCGLVLDPKDKLAIFFTLNGQLLGRKIPISPSVVRLFPSVCVRLRTTIIEANFGDDPAKPFEYDTNKCPGLELDCF